VLFTLPDDRHYHTKLVSHMISIKKAQRYRILLKTQQPYRRAALLLSAPRIVYLFLWRVQIRGGPPLCRERQLQARSLTVDRSCSFLCEPFYRSMKRLYRVSVFYGLMSVRTSHPIFSQSALSYAFLALTVRYAVFGSTNPSALLDVRNHRQG
jgi:hypothetical protein